MGTRFRFLAGIVVPVLLVGLSACNNSSSSSSSGTGAVFVASQGDSSVTSFSIDLSTGLLTANGGSVATGSVPSAMILAPSGTVLFTVGFEALLPAESGGAEVQATVEISSERESTYAYDQAA